MVESRGTKGVEIEGERVIVIWVEMERELWRWMGVGVR